MVLSTFLVTNTGDNGGLNPSPGDGTGTLRQAIVDANAAATGTAAVPDQIQFSISIADPGYNSTTGAFTIQPLSALPTITDPLILDGYTEPGTSPNTLTIGDNAVLKIVLDGSKAGAVDGLVLAGGNSTVRGLVIDNLAYGSAVVLKLQGNDVVAGNFIGTDVTGESAAPNNVGIVTNPKEPILSTGNRIGGTSPADRNVISGNNSAQPSSADGGTNRADFGLDIDNANLIEGNYIGTDKSGASAVPNGTGIVAGSNNTIGGLTTTPGTGAGNVISGNFGDGIDCGNQNVIAGNLIGTTATGLAALGNSAGILGDSYNTIGGTTPGARNIISGNTSGGIQDPGVGISGPYNLIEGNYIGTDITGTTLLGNPGGGIQLLSSYNTIGGTTAAARNIISNGFSGNPITIHQGGGQPPVLGNIVQGNYIGADVTGTQALANETGIVLAGGVYDTLIGGTVPGAGNVISGNHESLIALEGEEGTTDVPANTLIQGNLIGTDKSGAMLLGDSGNAETGIYIVDANNTTIGSTVPGAGNTIAFNGGYGVYINSGSGNSILGNSIFANSPLGIFLNSANNANNNQAFPVLTGMPSSGSGTTITGTLQSTANTTFRIEFFANASMDPSG
jgi:titin